MLSIDLTEPVVFLRRSSDITASGRRRQVTTETPPAVVRGILTLKLSKTTRIKQIQVFLEGTVTTEWPEGIGPRRSEISEQTTVLSSSAVLFRAGDHSPESSYRRAKSVGPGVSFGYHDSSDGESDHEEDERGRTGLRGNRDLSGSRSPSPYGNFNRGRGVSMDPFGRHRYPLTELPGYSVPSPMYSPETSLHDLPEEHPDPAQHLEELRNVLRDSTDHPVPGPPQAISGRSSSAIRSAASSRPTTASRSRPQSLHRPSFYFEPVALSPSPSRPHEDPSGSSSPALTPLSSPVASRRRLSFSRGRGSGSAGPSGQRTASATGHSPPQTPSLSHADDFHSRKAAPHKRFSFGVAWQEMKDRVKPSGRRASQVTERPHSPKVGSRPPSSVGEFPSDGHKREASRGRDRAIVSKLTGALGLEDDRKETDWEEFKKGTYNWPVSFTIPAECPPTLRCEYGSVTYRVRAHVARAGTWSSNLNASTEVSIIACPGEDDTEEIESIIVEREWDDRLRYLLSLSGKSFPIGGTMPLQLTLMPLSKMSIYRLSVILEEKVDYIAHGGKVARHEPSRHFTLLNLKDDDKHTSLLPIFSDSTDAALRSPLLPFVDESDSSDAAGQLLTPTGPWAFRFMLKVPDCTTQVHFTNKHSKAKIVVSHTVRIAIRVDKGDAAELDAKGKKKQFDIIIESPIQLLSCRCNPEWMSLPTYSFLPTESSENANGCICKARRDQAHSSRNQDVVDLDYPAPFMGGAFGLPAPRNHEPSPVFPVDIAPRSPVVRGPDTLDDRTRQFALLVAGAQSETGERPPTYEAAVA